MRVSGPSVRLQGIAPLPRDLVVLGGCVEHRLHRGGLLVTNRAVVDETSGVSRVGDEHELRQINQSRQLHARSLRDDCICVGAPEWAARDGADAIDIVGPDDVVLNRHEGTR